MRMLRDLPDQGLAVFIRHPVAWLNPDFLVNFVLELVFIAAFAHDWILNIKSSQ
jgi:hypothetical protein